MKTLYSILEQLITEGGASGHMAHPIDYTDFTKDDLIELIEDLFSGKIEDITEKIDGTNIQATMNTAGEVVFIRNKGDLNSAKGGMSISDMAAKWADKPSVANTFVTAGQTIEKVFNKIGKEWFNPFTTTRRVLNCECVIAGKTNIMPYATTQVDFHNIWIYEKDSEDPNSEWQKMKVTKLGLDKVEQACTDIDGAHITPKVIIEITKLSNSLAKKYIADINKLFNNENITIEEWLHREFIIYIKKSVPWLLDSTEGVDICFNRWFNMNKSVNLRILKLKYPSHESEITELDKKGYKDIVSDIMNPLNNLFLKLGNDVISLCRGIINQGQKDAVISQLIKDMDEVIKLVKSSDNIELQNKLTKQLNRLSDLGNQINPVEGIVFNYRGKLMKLTGSFAPLNLILGSIKFSR